MSDNPGGLVFQLAVRTLMAAPAILVSEYRSQILSLAKASDLYPFINAVDRYLAILPEDDETRANAVGALLKKGLISVAVNLARSCPPQTPQYTALTQAVRPLESSTQDVLQWSSQTPVFKKNLAAMRLRGETDALLADALEDVSRQLAPAATLHKANDGNLLVRIKLEDGRHAWCPAAADYANRLEAIPSFLSAREQFLTPVLFDGLGMGWLVSRVCSGTADLTALYRPAIFIVEPDLRPWVVTLHLHDWSAFLPDPRIYLLGGEGAWQRWTDLMERDESLPLPNVLALLRWPGQTPSNATDLVKRIESQRGATLKHEVGLARAQYAGRDVAFWARRYAEAGPGNPLRVLAITSRYTTFLQHATRDLLAAFERAGAVTRLLVETRDFEILPKQAYATAIRDFKPDLVLMADHHRHEYIERLVPDVPFVCWIQDELSNLMSPGVGEKLGPLDFTIGWGLSECVAEYGYPRERFMPSKIPVDPAKFASAPACRTSDEACCDVAYVSHQSETPAELHQRVRAMAGDQPARRLIDALYEETRALFTSPSFNGIYDLERLLKQIAQRAGISDGTPEQRQTMLRLFLRPLADRTLRQTTLTWAADWADATGRTLHLYGNGWERHPRLGRYARGPIEHGKNMGHIVRTTSINLHVGLTYGLHQRVLEILAAGGFLMLRWFPLDFLLPGCAEWLQCIREQGLTWPTDLSNLPTRFREDVTRLAEVTGRDAREAIELIARHLLIQQNGVWESRVEDDFADVVLPDFSAVTFSGPEQFAERAEHFLQHPQERQRILAAMQQRVLGLFTYDRLVSRLISFLRSRLQAAAST